MVGFPLDATASFRGGAQFGPNAVRELSESIETYSPYQDRDLEDLDLVDRGNLWPEAPLGLMERHLPALRREFSRVRKQARFTLYLAGEHTCTLAFLTEEDLADPHFHLLVLDAHLDLRASYQGSRYSHAAWARRALEALGPSRLLIAGARSGTREEFRLAREKGIWTRDVAGVRRWLEQRSPRARFHLSLDIDVLDPAHAPGTGNPEPLGWSVQEVLEVVHMLTQWRVVSADLVEYQPNLDASGRTGILVAFLAREMLLAFSESG